MNSFICLALLSLCLKMEFISFLALTLNWIFRLPAQLVETLLKANYLSMTFVIDKMNDVFTKIFESVLDVAAILQYYFADFLTFISEFYYGLSTVVAVFGNFMNETAAWIWKGFFSVLFRIEQIYSAVWALILSVCNAFLYALSTLSQVLQLIFSALILLLQLLPNIISLMYVSVVNGAKYLLLVVQNATTAGIHNCQKLSNHAIAECQNVIHRIPTNAYFGLVMIIILYYLREPIIRYLKHGVHLFLPRLISLLRKIIMSFHKLLLFVLSLILRPCVWLRNRVARSRATVNEVYSAPNIQNSQPSSSGINNAQKMGNLTQKLTRSIMGHSLTRRKALRFSDDDDDEVGTAREIEELKQIQKQLNEEKEKNLCSVCQDNPKSVILLPCRHLCLCQQCCNNLQQQNNFCPLCRNVIRNTLNVYV